MTMTWEERYRVLMTAMKSNQEFWTPWLFERTTESPMREFWAFSDKEIQAATDLLAALDTIAQDMRNDSESEPTEV